MQNIEHNLDKSSISQYISQISNTYFGRWIQNFRVSFLLIALLVIYGTMVLFQIPKESSPDIKFGIVQIITAYPGASPVDIDETITTKIEKQIKDLPGIDKMESTSSLGISRTVITSQNDINTKDFINDVRSKIDGISFPDDVKDPMVSEISSDNKILFQMILYAPKDAFTMNQVRSLAMDMKKDLIGKGGIVDVKIDGIAGDSDYDVAVLLDKQELESLGLTVSSVVSQIRSYNQNLPLGNFKLGDLKYDYRIDNAISSISDLSNINIKLSSTSNDYVKLGDISQIIRKYKNTSVSYGGIYDSSDNYAVSMSIYKGPNANIFDVSNSARQIIKQTSKKIKYQGLQYEFTRDVTANIVDDYVSLGWNGITSILLVLIITWIFISLRQAVIAVLGFVISFFITFMVLDYMGYSMNFMTNFSLILAFGMGIDTVLVFIEAGYENIRKGYNPKTAILLAINTYKSANINSSLINICVFIPMLVLPGIMGKFLSYIPITIFATLLASLLLSLTVNGALFYKLNRKSSVYYPDSEYDTSSDIEKDILFKERQGKTPIDTEHEPFFEKYFDIFRSRYISILQGVISSKTSRMSWIFGPFVLLILSFFLGLGFNLFPTSDNPYINFQVIAQEGTDTSKMVTVGSGIDQIISHISGIQSYDINIQNNLIDIGVVLVKKDNRTQDSFDVQDILEDKLSYLSRLGYKVQSKVQQNGPPGSKPVGIKLVSNNTDDLTTLKKVSHDFENYLRTLTGLININNSSKTTPGQFVLKYDEDKLAQLGIAPSDIQMELYTAINGSKAGSVKFENIDRDLVVKIDEFEYNISPELIKNTVINTRSGPVTIGSVASISSNISLASISREDGDIMIKVESDIQEGLASSDFQPKLEAFAESYNFPGGVSRSKAGETQANADLINAMVRGFIIALFLAFIILVYQFNSFGRPLVILYSIPMAMLGVNIGLKLTGNTYSIPVFIGFISLIGVVINTSIFIVDRIQQNINKGVDIQTSILEAGYTRFKPIIISSITTILGLAPSVTQDDFYASLGYTVIFGLIFSAVITLVAVPSLYYSLYAPKELIEQQDIGEILEQTEEV